MVIFASILMILLLLFLLAPTLILVIEAVASVLPDSRRSMDPEKELKVAVIVPAHNEEQGICETLCLLHAELSDGDTLLVVADNCSDQTAHLAYQAGAEVVERHDPQRRGKGYALAQGIQHLSASPPDIVVFIDADCRFSEGGIAHLAQCAARWLRPVQARNIVIANPSEPRSAISSLAFCFKNIVRARGANRLGLPCHLMGTGMAIPWHITQQLPFSSGELVEDLQLGFSCVAAGFNPLLCSPVSVVSHSPPNATAALAQRKRWEHGHLHFIATQVTKLLIQGIRDRNLSLVALCLDTAVPPLTMLIGMQLLGVVLTALYAAATGMRGALLIACLTLLLSLLALGVGWATEGRKIIPFRQLASVPMYMLWKLPLYFGYFWNREKTWIRTER
jgi:cellulose synthase/poly-beta-1,6-N-acetylglucosamine synthase-like glycosyltransferase